LFTHDAEHSSKRVFNRTASSLATDLIFKTKTAKNVATKKSLEGVQAPGREAVRAANAPQLTFCRKSCYKKKFRRGPGARPRSHCMV
jgi:hypothetical protein